MVAADHEYCKSHFLQTGDELIERGHGFALGRGFLVYVPGDQHRVGPLTSGDLLHLTQQPNLILQK